VASLVTGDSICGLELLLMLDLLSNFFLDLLQGLQEELLDLASLVDDDLTESSNIAEFTVFNTQVFFGVYDVFLLLLDDRVMLVTNQLLFLFEVGYDLLETAFKDLNLALVDLDFLSLALGSSLVLVLCSRIESHVSL
jgi:hypothetical protein